MFVYLLIIVNSTAVVTVPRIWVLLYVMYFIMRSRYVCSILSSSATNYNSNKLQYIMPFDSLKDLEELNKNIKNRLNEISDCTYSIRLYEHLSLLYSTQ